MNSYHIKMKGCALFCGCLFLNSTYQAQGTKELWDQRNTHNTCLKVHTIYYDRHAVADEQVWFATARDIYVVKEESISAPVSGRQQTGRSDVMPSLKHAKSSISAYDTTSFLSALYSDAKAQQVFIDFLKTPNLLPSSSFRPHEKRDLQALYARPLWFRSNLLNAFCVLALGGISIIALLSTSTSLQQHKQKGKQMQQQILWLKTVALKNQLNPHFIFNSLNPLQYYILNDQAPQALHYLDSFAALLRGMLQSAGKESHCLADEITFLNQYLQVQEERYSPKFTFRIETGITDLQNFDVPILLIQPVVENSIEHGLADAISDGYVHIHFGQEGPYLLVTVTDNGKGPESPDVFHDGHGLSVIKKRLELMQTALGKQGHISFTRRDNTTIFTLHIPQEIKPKNEYDHNRYHC